MCCKHCTLQLAATLSASCCRYPAEAVNYFLEPSRVASGSFFNTFVALLEMPDASPLRAQLAASEAKLLALLGVEQPPPAEVEKSEAQGKEDKEEKGGKEDKESSQEREGSNAAAQAGKESAEGDKAAAAASATAAGKRPCWDQWYLCSFTVTQGISF